MRRLALVAALCACHGAAPAPHCDLEESVAEASDAGPPQFCMNFDPQRQAFFGDLHVHTSYSLDAFQFHTPTDPVGAYAYGRGGTITLAPADGAPRTQTAARPLDFMAVTDHAEYFGVTQPSGGNAQTCWEREKTAAEQAYDRSQACSFTTFIAYEWSGVSDPGNVWLHRNVIFKNDTVPAMPISSKDQTTPEGLWSALLTSCINAGTGCDAIAIPHNSNYSHGVMYSVPDTIAVDQARMRQQLEPLAEIYQYKGSSECNYGGAGATDTECKFEQEFVPDCSRTPLEPTCTAGNWVRSALERGIQLEQAIGVNPLKLGIIGGTDTHNALPGGTDEWAFQGHHGADDATPQLRLTDEFVRRSPGGLTVVWAEQNTREDIFAALKRREVYATSGTRSIVRFFGGFDLDESVCTCEDFVSLGYAHGVPMGGTLHGNDSNKAPTFAVSALRDPGTPDHPGNKLEQIQIVKGWVDGNGEIHEKVVRIAGKDNDGSSVERNTCNVNQHGKDTLCGAWTDPDFDPAQRAFYYARVLEDPSCASRQFDCLAIDKADRPASCNDSKFQFFINERAWTSPIWYTPVPDPTQPTHGTTGGARPQ